MWKCIIHFLFLVSLTYQSKESIALQFVHVIYFITSVSSDMSFECEKKNQNLILGKVIDLHLILLGVTLKSF